jgi:hypothetical protein
MAIAAVSAASGQPGRLVVACRDGMVCVLDARGMSVAQGKVDGIPLIAQQLTDADVVIAASAGAATAYRVR